MTLRSLFPALGALAFSIIFASGARADAITVFAAASLKDTLEAIALSQDAAVAFSFAGSGTIARQIAAGAPADVVVLAHPDWMDWLETKTSLTQRRDVAGNRLALIGPASSADMPSVTLNALQTRLGEGRLAVGQTDSVPAGLYAKAWLSDIGAWEAMKPKLAETDNVRAALVLVGRGETPLGVVYRSDVLADPSVKTLYLIPSQHHERIRYPAAALTPEGEAFVKYLTSPDAALILKRYGFDPSAKAPG